MVLKQIFKVYICRMKYKLFIILALAALLVNAAKKAVPGSSPTDAAVASSSDPVIVFEVSDLPSGNNYALYGSL